LKAEEVWLEDMKRECEEIAKMQQQSAAAATTVKGSLSYLA
jgi:hypothetical protein